MIIHLTTHSSFSLQEGLASPDELVQAAVNENMPAIGLADHQLLTGTVEFIKACVKAGIQPILGLEIDTLFGKIVLLAMNMAGWTNLCRVSSELSPGGSINSVDSFERLSTHSPDIIAMPFYSLNQGGMSGVPSIETTIQKLKDIYQDRLYLPIFDPNEAVSQSMLAQKLKCPTVATHPIYYINKKDNTLQKTLTAIRLNQPLTKTPLEACAPKDAYFLSGREMKNIFEHFPASLASQMEIADRCRFTFPLGKIHMPTIPLPDGISSMQYLREKVEAGAKRLYGKISLQIRQRLDHELEVIAQLGYEPIFLIVEEILNFARKSSIPFSSRGSAASSLVAHCLGITSPDPIHLDLYFERFLNPARSTPPDIDTDICSRRRDQVIEHVFETFGIDQVAMVCTINRYRPRSALGETAKAHGMDPRQIRELVEQLPYGFWARSDDANEDSVVPSPFAGMRDMQFSSKYKQIFDEAEALLKLPRHLSVHAGGIVVAPGPMTDYVPVMRSGSKGVTITQFDLKGIQALGLVKIDLLGIRGLTVQGDVAEIIAASYPEIYQNPMAVLDSTPTDDPETAERVEKGGTIGCFQIESPGMRATLREIHARSQDDIMVALALFRPGPLGGGMKEAFVKRFKGEEAVSHIHPALEPILAETFGVILYQEQVLRIANQLAGFSLAEADLLRRAMSHFDPGKQMETLQQTFIERSRVKSDVPLETAARIWEMMAAFAGYGFPKAHAASYAQVAWRSAWCKTHFPGEFMAAVLANWGGYYSQRVYLSEARRLQLKSRPPHINFSGKDFSYRMDEMGIPSLFMGLDQIKDMTQRTIGMIIRERPFHSLEDFLTRVDPQKKEAINLVKVGALEGFGTIPSILGQLDKGWQPKQPSLFSDRGQDANDWDARQKAEAQTEILGISLELHPLDRVEGKIRNSGAVSIIDAASRVGQKVTIAGIRQSGHHSRTTKGETMMFLTLEDNSGMLDVVLFPTAYKQFQNVAFSNKPLLVSGVVEMDTARSEPMLNAEKIEIID